MGSDCWVKCKDSHSSEPCLLIFADISGGVFSGFEHYHGHPDLFIWDSIKANWCCRERKDKIERTPKHFNFSSLLLRMVKKRFWGLSWRYSFESWCLHTLPVIIVLFTLHNVVRRICWLLSYAELNGDRLRGDSSPANGKYRKLPENT